MGGAINRKTVGGGPVDRPIKVRLPPNPVKESGRSGWGARELSMSSTPASNPALTPAFTLYTDGGCSPNPGPGGWGFVLDASGEGRMERCGGDPDSTNNRMELTAVIRGLEALKEPCEVTLFADSSYVLQGMSSWMTGWKKRGWKRKDGSSSFRSKTLSFGSDWTL